MDHAPDISGSKLTAHENIKPSSTIDNKPTSTNQGITKPVSKAENNTNATSASLLHRLAGPSTGKAGLAKDQTEITRVIAEASEGSKFYQNEKKKDEELSRKIDALLKQRDQLLAMADIASLETTADKVIAELEASRDLTQAIVHMDMDSFYASVEMLDDPTLIGKPFGVGGPSKQSGVLSTASYAARVFGVRSGMATYIAKKLCPELIMVPSHFGRYHEISSAVMDILRRFDPDMDPAGVDEAYLNITEYCATHDLEPEECVQEIRRIIFEETKLTASAGIAPNKMLAKICSERNKPNGQFRLANDSEAVMEFTKTLPIRRIPGIGRVSERLLSSIGINNCGDIYTHRVVLVLLDKHFHLRDKLEIYLGLGSTNVKPWPREARKSVGAERTFHAISDPALINEKLDHVSKELEEDMERLGYAGSTITLKVKLDTFEVRSRAKTVHRPVKTYDEFMAIGKELLAHEMPLRLRLLGLRVTNLKDLRLPERGIKRFFAQADNPQPNKKRKLGADREEAIYILDDDDDEIKDTFKDNDEGLKGKRAATATPERPRTQNNLEAEVVPRASSHEPMGSQEVTLMKRPIAKRTPQTSTASTSTKPSSSSAKPTSSKAITKGKSTNPTVTTEQHICPICSKTFQTDNAGLNAHIDWCLSRSAILEASAASNGVEGSKSGGSKKGGGLKKGEVKKGFGSGKAGTSSGKQDIRLAWK